MSEDTKEAAGFIVRFFEAQANRHSLDRVSRDIAPLLLLWGSTYDREAAASDFASAKREADKAVVQDILCRTTSARDAGLVAEVERLRAALTEARDYIQADHDALLESVTIGGDPATMDDMDAGHVAESMQVLERVKAALSERPDAQ